MSCVEMEVSTSLAALTRARKRIDSDAQQLSNRIKLLQLEEQKTLKKVQATRRKAQTIRQVQRLEHKKLQLSEQLQEQRDLLITQKRERNVQLREELKLQHQRSLEALIQRKRRQAMAVKRLLLSDRQKNSFLHLHLQEANFARVKGIQQDKLEAQLRAKTHQSRKRAHLKGTYYERIEEEESRTKAREQTVVDMELVEMELIEKLRATQRMQREAEEVLQSAFSQRPRSLRSSH